MFIQKISICNLFAYYGKVDVEFRQNDAKNLYCIYGDNGFGKTSFIRCAKLLFLGLDSAIVQRFYKKDIGQKQLLFGNNEWSGIINKSALKEGLDEYYVAFEGLLDDGPFCLKRSFEDVLQREIKECLYLEIDGEVYMDDLARERLNRILPSLFVEFFFFDGEEIEEISNNIHSGLREKMESILQITPVDLLIQGLRTTKKNLILQQEKNQETKDHLSLLDSRIEHQNKELEISESIIQRFSDTEKQKLEEKERLKIDLQDLIANNDIQRRDLIHEKDRIDAQMQQQKADLKDNLKYIVPLANRKILQELEQHIEALKEHTDRKDIEGYKRCVEKISRDMLDGVIGKYSTTDQQKKSLGDIVLGVLKDLEHRLSEEGYPQGILPNEAIQSITSNLIRIESSALEKHVESLCKLKKDLRYVKERIDELNVDDVLAAKKEEIQFSIKELEDEIKKKQEEKESKKEECRRLKDGIDRSQKERDLLYSKINTERIEKQLEILRGLEKIFEAYKQRLILTLKDNLCDGILRHYKKLIPNDNLAKIEIDSNFKITIKDLNDEMINVANQSSGQKQILAIAIFWTLSALSGSKIPLIIDTPLSRIDATNRHNIITNYYHQNNQVIILPHNGEMTIREYEVAQDSIAGLYKIENSDDRGHAKIKAAQKDAVL